MKPSLPAPSPYPETSFVICGSKSEAKGWRRREKKRRRKKERKENSRRGLDDNGKYTLFKNHNEILFSSFQFRDPRLQKTTRSAASVRAANAGAFPGRTEGRRGRKYSDFYDFGLSVFAGALLFLFAVTGRRRRDKSILIVSEKRTKNDARLAFNFRIFRKKFPKMLGWGGAGC